MNQPALTDLWKSYQQLMEELETQSLNPSLGDDDKILLLQAISQLQQSFDLIKISKNHAEIDYHLQELAKRMEQANNFLRHLSSQAHPPQQPPAQPKGINKSPSQEKHLYHSVQHIAHQLAQTQLQLQQLRTDHSRDIKKRTQTLLLANKIAEWQAEMEKLLALFQHESSQHRPISYCNVRKLLEEMIHALNKSSYQYDDADLQKIIKAIVLQSEQMLQTESNIGYQKPLALLPMPLFSPKAGNKLSDTATYCVLHEIEQQLQQLLQQLETINSKSTHKKRIAKRMKIMNSIEEHLQHLNHLSDEMAMLSSSHEGNLKKQIVNLLSTITDNLQAAGESLDMPNKPIANNVTYNKIEQAKMALLAIKRNLTAHAKAPKKPKA